MRFTIRSLLLLCAGFAALSAVCFALPIALANGVMAVTTLALPAVDLGGAMFAPQAQKAFFVGALIPFGAYFFRDSGTEFHVCQSFMISLYSRFRGVPDPLSAPIEAPTS